MLMNSFFYFYCFKTDDLLGTVQAPNSYVIMLYVESIITLLSLKFMWWWLTINVNA
jgi:hypothetical protein